MSEVKSKKRRLWSDDDIEYALSSVREGMSINQASQLYSIPRMTLSDRIKHKVKPNCKVGRPTSLSDEEEATLVRYVEYMAERRYPITRDQVIGLAWSIALKNGSN